MIDRRAEEGTSGAVIESGFSIFPYGPPLIPSPAEGPSEVPQFRVQAIQAREPGSRVNVTSRIRFADTGMQQVPTSMFAAVHE